MVVLKVRVFGEEVLSAEDMDSPMTSFYILVVGIQICIICKYTAYNKGVLIEKIMK